MKYWIPALLALAAVCCAGADGTAARLAREAHDAELAGQIVRAYLLYGEAAARDPSNLTYRSNRDSLALAANLLTKADIEKADISADVKAAEGAEKSGAPPPVELATEQEWRSAPDLLPVPHIHPVTDVGTFSLRGNTKTLFEQVTAVYGVRVMFDPELHTDRQVRLDLEGADFRTAMEALTAVTHTFVFPISEHEILAADDTEIKRSELEPQALMTFPLPNALEQKDVIEAANAVRAVLNLRTIGWDSVARMVMIRDRVTRARVGRALMESLLLPRGQVSFEVQFMTLDADKNYHYGFSLQTAFQLLDLGHIGAFQPIYQAVTNPTNFLAFGGGATLFGIGLSDTTLFATYSNAMSQVLYDATVVVGDGQTASLHIGDKYPIPQTVYSGFSQTASSIYNPVGQFTLEDLGLVLKMTPRINGDGDVSIEVEADYKTLGTQTIDAVPEVNEREYKGTVMLRAGQLAVLAGMDASTRNSTRTGPRGLAGLRGVNQVLAENTRETRTSHTLLVIKPTVTRLPMSAIISPQFLIGTARGERVLI